MENFNPENNLFAITIADVQYEAMEKIGRELTEDELLVAKKGLESGLMFDIDSVYSTIFEEMI
jgi:hypothetical protein